MAEQTTQERIWDMISEAMRSAEPDAQHTMTIRLAAEIDGLRAEIARLKPAAEAFWAYEVFTATYLREDRDKFAAAAVRARAAKVTP